jgi:ADP-heptose:LPS heptosyltransferase
VGSLKFLRSLAKRKYDVSINTHPQSKLEYRLVATLAGAKLRLSHNYHHSEIFGWLLGDRTMPQDYEKHSVDQTLDLFSFMGIKPVLPSHEYELFLTEEEITWGQKFVQEHQLEGQKLFAFHVGTSGTKNLALRRWPVRHYIGLIRRFQQNHPNVSILLFGGPEEVQLHAEILANVPPERVHNVKSSNFRQSAAVLRLCEMVISGDTSIMHLAAAVKVPKQFVLETPTFYKPNHPYGQPFVTICNPAVAGQNLKYYLYNGKGIQGSPDELRRLMSSITVDLAYETIRSACAFL